MIEINRLIKADNAWLVECLILTKMVRGKISKHDSGG